MPLSITEIAMGLRLLSSSLFKETSIEMLPSEPVNLIALERKFRSTCANFVLSLEKVVNESVLIDDSRWIFLSSACGVKSSLSS
jgi:hypothetical protein